MENQVREEKSLAYRRTDSAIRHALCRLLKRKPYNEIIIADILEETPVSRTTFYKHYYDKDAVAEAILRDVKEALSQVLPTAASLARKEELAEYSRNLGENYRDEVQALMSIPFTRIQYQQAVIDIFMEDYLNRFSSNHDRDEAFVYAYAQMAFVLLNADRTIERGDGFIRHHNEIIANVFLSMTGLKKIPGVREYLWKLL